MVGVHRPLQLKIMLSQKGVGNSLFQAPAKKSAHTVASFPGPLSFPSLAVFFIHMVRL